MKLKEIKDPSIAKEKFDYISNVKNKLEYGKWVAYMDAHQDDYTWYENTIDGIYMKNNIDKVPENFREGELLSLSKHQVFSEFNSKKGYYEIRIVFNDKTGVIGTTFMKSISRAHVAKLIELANHMGAYLLNDGTDIIDEKVLERL